MICGYLLYLVYLVLQMNVSQFVMGVSSTFQNVALWFMLPFWKLNTKEVWASLKEYTNVVNLSVMPGNEPPHHLGFPSSRIPLWPKTEIAITSSLYYFYLILFLVSLPTCSLVLEFSCWCLGNHIVVGVTCLRSFQCTGILCKFLSVVTEFSFCSLCKHIHIGVQLLTCSLTNPLYLSHNYSLVTVNVTLDPNSCNLIDDVKFFFECCIRFLKVLSYTRLLPKFWAHLA